MRYLTLKNALKDFTVFSLNDIRKVDENFFRSRLNEWQGKGYIRKVVRGYYVFSDLKLTENILFEIANRIYSPSYVSLETALSYYHLIPEGVYTITSISTRRTYGLQTPIANFTYRTVKKNLFFGYDLTEQNQKHFKIAFAEKALLDYFYLNPGIKKKDDFTNIRVDKDAFFAGINEEKLGQYLEIFGRKQLTQRINSFLGFLKND